MIRIKSVENEFNQILDLARSLPEWFTEDGICQMAKDLPCQHSLIATSHGTAVGFLSYYSHEGIAHIGWMAVERSCQRKGIGSALVLRLLNYLSELSISEVRVKTLGESIDYEPYVGTRLFYYSLGFLKSNVTHQDNPDFPEELELSLILKSN